MSRAAFALVLVLLCSGSALASGLPPLPPPTDADRVAAVPQAWVREFRFSGNTRVPDAELAHIAAPWTGRELATADLLEVRATLVRHYRELGYVGADVVLPDQRIRDGVVELRIAEGSLAEVRVVAGRSASARWAQGRLERVTGGVLDVRALQEELELLQQEPWIERVDALLRPTSLAGVAQLDVEIRERPALRTGLRVANDRTPAIGSFSRELELDHASLSGRGDAFAARLGQTEGLLEWQLDYRRPLGSSPWALELGTWRSRADVVERPFDDLDIESRATTWRAGLAWSALRSPSRSLGLALHGELRRSETELAGLDFWPGTDDGHADLTVLRFSQDYQQRVETWALAACSVLSFGLDAFDATRFEGSDALGEEPGDGRFSAWLGQLYWLRQLSPTPGGVELLARAALQLSPDPLLAIERMPLGGADSVRGYRSHELLRDNGVQASLELRVPLWRGREAAVSLAPFADFGHGWNRHENPDVKTLASIGLGLRGRWRGLELSAYYGHALRDLSREGDDLQDRGVHLELRARSF